MQNATLTLKNKFKFIKGALNSVYKKVMHMLIEKM